MSGRFGWSPRRQARRSLGAPAGIGGALLLAAGLMQAAHGVPAGAATRVAGAGVAGAGVAGVPVAGPGRMAPPRRPPAGGAPTVSVGVAGRRAAVPGSGPPAGPAPTAPGPAAPVGPVPVAATPAPPAGGGVTWWVPPVVSPAAGQAPPPAELRVDATRLLGPESHVGQGFLHSVYPTGDEQQLLADLGPTAWRSAIVGSPLDQSNGARWKTAEATPVPVTLILSDMWWAGPGDHGAVAPWADWNSYREWVATTVVEVLAAGYRVDYWEVYNEPDRPSDYYTPAVAATVTAPRLLQQFLVADQAITMVDGSARIVGPALSAYSAAATARSFSLDQFLSFADSQGIALAAVSWHLDSSSPAAAAPEVAGTRRLLAAHPRLGRPAVFIDEYGSPAVQRIPGWDVAYLAALAASGADQAERSCWSGDCNRAVLDGLLAPDGVGTLPDYWLRRAYARMDGSRVVASSSGAGISVLAVVGSDDRSVTVMVGRGVGCQQDPRCPAGHPDAAAVAARLVVHVPWPAGSVTVQSTAISGRAPAAPAAAPATVTWRTRVAPGRSGGGDVVVGLTALGDGDAVVLRMGPG